MTAQRNARPLSLAAAGRAAETTSVASTRQSDSSTEREAVALAIFKRNKLCIVAKLTFLDDERILALAHKAQHGVKTTISVPLVVLDYAEKRNVRYLYFRRDTTAEMYRISLSELRKTGWLATSDGVAEYFIKIDQMQKCVWRRWQFAERVVRLDEQHENSKQLELL